MSGIDDFDDLFNSFQDRQKQKKGKKILKKPQIAFDELPIWKSVKEIAVNSVCNVCRRKIDDEDLVEACKYCHRYYHFRHFREWLKIKGICPVCGK
ncbi:MAG: hypothetical protein IH840_10815 [Candidatus Heimdallarchaeota archaeon]|nr:hypothetical protein [Candidatus Heimdallarchaeota archaeon]